MTTTISGSIHALVTPFHDDESLDLDQMRLHTDRAVRAGADGVFCLGTNGEFFQQTEDERLAVLEAVVDATAGRVPVYGGAGAVGTKETVRIARRMQAAGADVLSVITPYFAAASQDELYRHFAVVAEAVDVPVLVYNIPARTGNTISPATVARLAEIDNIAGVKDSSGNFDAILQLIELTDPEHFAVLAGTDSLVLPTLQAGGAGGITAVANVYPGPWSRSPGSGRRATSRGPARRRRPSARCATCSRSATRTRSSRRPPTPPASPWGRAARRSTC